MSAAQWQDSIWVWILFTGLVAVLGVAAYAQVDPAGFAHGWRTVINIVYVPTIMGLKSLKKMPWWFVYGLIYGTIGLIATVFVLHGVAKLRNLLF